jgi:hypothetical protein
MKFMTPGWLFDGKLLQLPGIHPQKPLHCGKEKDMALMLGALNDALKSAGEKARKAAEEVAAYDNRVNGLEGRMSSLDGRMAALEGRMAGLENRFNAMQWMIGLNMAMTLGVLWKVLTL